MYDINALQIGDIMICGRRPNRQMFYIHKIDKKNKIIYSSGIYESDSNSYFEFFGFWNFNRKGTDEEKLLFYKLIKERNWHLSKHNGVHGCL